MEFQQIKTKRVILHINDTGRDSSLFQKAKVKRYFKESLSCLEDFFWGKIDHGLDLSLTKIEQVEISLVLCGKAKIKKLNNEFRNKDKITDVLSFPIHENLRNEKHTLDFFEGNLNLGDVIICKEVAQKQAEEFEIGLIDELIHLWFHGALHLCGFDHEMSEGEEIIMFGLEDKLMDRFQKKINK
jgi:probable rRNA maturation factor